MRDELTVMWMVRAGEGGFRFDDFKSGARVSIGWLEMGNLEQMLTREEFTRAVEQTYPGLKKGQIASFAGQPFRFVREMQVGDAVVTYNSAARVYLVGTITGGYEFAPHEYPEQPNIRRVQWRGEVPRDALSVASRNSLGAIATLFQVPAEAAAEVERRLAGGQTVQTPVDAPMTGAAPTAPTGDGGALANDVRELYLELHAKSLEFIKDKVNQLDWQDMQELVAGLLRAMGYKTRISPSGSDRGKDIVASKDGLGFEDPRIVVEVKHRQAAMGAPEVRAFLGGRHDHDKGLYVSTGGFTKEARYESERARIPVTLIDLDDLVKLLHEHYEGMDLDAQRLVPLRKVYWPA